MEHFSVPHLTDKMEDEEKIEAILKWSQDLVDSLNRMATEVKSSNERKDR